MHNVRKQAAERGLSSEAAAVAKLLAQELQESNTAPALGALAGNGNVVPGL
jgi:hypothetical protein